jgi:hypothetical protein
MSKHCSLRYTLEIFEKELYAIGQSKHEAKKAYGGKTPKIYSYGTLTRYFGIAKEFVDKMYQEGIRRVNQVQVEHFMRYLKEKAEETRQKRSSSFFQPSGSILEPLRGERGRI